MGTYVSDRLQEISFEFKRNNTVIVFIPDIEYNYVEQLARRKYRDSRSVKSILNCYAVVKLFKYMACTTRYVPIHSDVFKSVGSANKYSEYLQFLEENDNLIDTRGRITKEYHTMGRKFVKTITPKRYRPAHMGYYGCNSIFPPKSEKQYQVSLKFSDEIYYALKKKLEQYKFYSNNQEKLERIFSINNRECYAVHLFVELLNRILKGKINSDIVIRRHIKKIAETRFGYSNCLEDKVKDIDRLLCKIKDVVKEKDKIEHIEETYLSENNDGQDITRVMQSQDMKSKYSYYSELTLDPAGLDQCMTFRDLYAISDLNTIPEENEDGKLYSTFSRIRRPIRKYIRFRGEYLVEVTDVHCAHYTMLPIIFRNYSIIIPEEEMKEFIKQTQKGDLYADAVKGTGITRDAIKPVFQSFYSIKNENQYLYEGICKEERFERQTVCNYFTSKYPSIYKAILDFHRTHRCTLKRAANRVESAIMNSICARLITLGLHPFRLHDAIYMTRSKYWQVPFDITEEVYKAINAK